MVTRTTDARCGDDGRLRPLSRTLAFSRPLTGQSGVRVPPFQTKMV